MVNARSAQQIARSPQAAYGQLNRIVQSSFRSPCNLAIKRPRVAMTARPSLKLPLRFEVTGLTTSHTYLCEPLPPSTVAPKVVDAPDEEQNSWKRCSRNG